MRGRERLRTRWFVAVGIVAAALALGALALDLFRSTELDTVDARFSIRGEEDPPDDIVLVLVDDKTFSDLRLRWPFPREIHGELVNRLSEGGAKAIAYDVQFSEPSNEGGSPPPNAGCGAGPAKSVNDDLAFAQAIADAGNVVISVTEEDDRGRALLFGCADLKDFPEPDIYADLLARPGNANIPNDPGGVKRRVPYAPDRIESFAVAVAETATEEQVSRDDFEEEDGTAWIDFHGPPGTIPSVPFSEAVDGRVKPEFFKDKIVVVGASAPALQDVPTPHARRRGDARPRDPGQRDRHGDARLPAPIRAGLARHRADRAARRWSRPSQPAHWRAAWRSASGSRWGSCTSSPRSSPSTATTSCRSSTRWCALVLSLVGTLPVQYFTTAFERQRVRDMFSRFVPENVVDDVLARSDGAPARRRAARGHRDVQRPARLHELRRALPVERVIDVLNKYLSRDVRRDPRQRRHARGLHGRRHHGRVRRPVEQPDHADRALAASRAMLGERLAAFNDYLREEGLSEQGFRMGIGLNSGPVMSGNVGSERRLEYTAIGDTTNTAARLEGMTKGTPHMLYVSEATREALQTEAPDLEFVGEFEVRGRQAKIRLWSLPDAAAAPTPEHSGEPAPEAVETGPEPPAAP